MQREQYSFVTKRQNIIKSLNKIYLMFKIGTEVHVNIMGNDVYAMTLLFAPLVLVSVFWIFFQ